jgi:hypothetical protein
MALLVLAQRAMPSCPSLLDFDQQTEVLVWSFDFLNLKFLYALKNSVTIAFRRNKAIEVIPKPTFFTFKSPPHSSF